MSSENLTLFTKQNFVNGSCNAKICKLYDNVVQLRLDFKTFVISNPNHPTLEDISMGVMDLEEECDGISAYQGK